MMESFNQQFRRLPIWVRIVTGIAIVGVLSVGGLIIWLFASDLGAPCTATFMKDHTLLNVPGSTEQVADVSKGQTAPVLRRTSDGWIEVEISGTTGWAYADPANFVETSGYCAGIPVADPDQ
jgi:hypothetical protein